MTEQEFFSDPVCRSFRYGVVDRLGLILLGLLKRNWIVLEHIGSGRSMEKCCGRTALRRSMISLPAMVFARGEGGEMV